MTVQVASHLVGLWGSDVGVLLPSGAVRAGSAWEREIIAWYDVNEEVELIRLAQRLRYICTR